jgi:uncharacterized membrane protein
MMSEQDIFSIVLFGLMANFFFSIMLGVLINRNVGIMEVVKIVRGKKKVQPFYQIVLIIVPFAKAVHTLYRVYILQVYFLNQGKSYKDFLLYMMK